MQQSGYKIIPINPNVDEVLNEKSYQSLKEVEEEIDIVNVFRRSEHLPAIANEAKDLNIKGFWAQQGVIHEDVPTILEKNDALVMMDLDRNSTRLNSSHVAISYDVFCLK